MTASSGPSGDGNDDEPRSYRVEVSEAADAEADAIYLWLGQHRSPVAADRWYRGLLAAYQTLTLFPYRYIALPRRPNVRRLLYQNWRALYTVIEPQSPGDEAVVRILHVYHGAQHIASDEPDEQPDDEQDEQGGAP